LIVTSEILRILTNFFHYVHSYFLILIINQEQFIYLSVDWLQMNWLAVVIDYYWPDIVHYYFIILACITFDLFNYYVVRILIDQSTSSRCNHSPLLVHYGKNHSMKCLFRCKRQNRFIHIHTNSLLFDQIYFISLMTNYMIKFFDHK